MSTNVKRCSSGKNSTLGNTTTNLSRSKTCALSGPATMKTKTARLQPLPVKNDENPLDELTNLHPAMINELVLHARDLKTIPNLSQFSKLQILDLSCNQITRIDNLRCLINLRELKLYGNQIEKIENLECLTQLQILQVQFNDISSIGLSLSYLTRLQTLRLDSNPLKTIRSEDLQKLTQLKILNVSDSSLENLDFVNSIGSLSELRAANCHLKILPSSCRNLRNLIDLDLSTNELRQIQPLKLLSTLRVLHLNENEIDDVEILSHLIHLNELDLSFNRIVVLPNSFEKLVDLQSLNLSNNRIRTFSDIDVLRRLKSLFILSIEANPLINETENYLKKFVELCPTLEILDDINVQKNQTKILPNESNEQVLNIDKELKEVDLTLERSIAAVEAQFESIASELRRIETLTKRPNTTSSFRKHRLFQALAFSEENYLEEQEKIID